MHAMAYSLNILFQQLGLDHDDASIEQFIQEHAPLSEEVVLAEASFWTPAQSSFLTQALAEDSEWCEVTDTLNALLRH